MDSGAKNSAFNFSFTLPSFNYLSCSLLEKEKRSLQ